MSKNLEIILRKKTHQIPIQDGQSILEAAIVAELAPPYSCLEGHCYACEAKLKKGSVEEEDRSVRPGDNFRSCMSKIKSDDVQISYDEL